MVNTKKSLSKIVILDLDVIGPDLNLEVLQSLGELTCYGRTQKSEIVARCLTANIIITNKVILDKTVLEHLKYLELICISATGLNNIDLDYCSENNIQVKNVKGYSTNSVSQLTFAMALHFLTPVQQMGDFSKSGEWFQSGLFTSLAFPISDLAAKKWGIIGLGEIGRQVAKVASAFGAEVQYYSTSGMNQNSDYNAVELSQLLSTSDIISIHAPLNDKTLNLIGYKELLLLKENSILINVGRGGIINESDLAIFIDEKHNLKVALDVLEQEPFNPNSPLDKVKYRDNLLITPHIAWASQESRIKLFKGVEDNIKSFLNN